MNDKYFSRDNLELVVEGLKFGIKENLSPIINDLKEKNVTPNWNQNDPNALDYITNRTHYEIPEVYIPLDIIDGNTILYDWNKDESYVLRVDGTIYSFNSMTKGGYHSPSGQYIWYLGSRTRVGIDGTSVDTWDYPFSIYCVENMIADGYMNVQFEDGTSNHTIERIIKEKEIYYLDPKYIKDMYYENDKSINLSIVESTGHASGYTSYKVGPYAWDIDKELTICVDGVTYTFNGFTYDGFVNSLGMNRYRIGAPYASGSITDSSEYPFVIIVFVGVGEVEEYAHIEFADGTDNHTVKIPLIEIKTIDEKYIPDTIARVEDVADQIYDALQNSVADWNQNDETAPDFIKNKPDVVLRSEIEEIDAITLVVETGLVSPAVAEDGSIYTDENGVLYSL